MRRKVCMGTEGDVRILTDRERNVTKHILGISIGGTKSRVSFGAADGASVRILGGKTVGTAGRAPADLLGELAGASEAFGFVPDAVGITCGGPLDERAGLILSPPNLPGWDRIEATKYFAERFGTRTRLLNDANAGALAEWKFGAGKGKDNVVFLTFGTGFGAGLILGGRLYAGANGNAGEIGHVRIAEGGNIGYGKAGSCEGYVSGGGMAQTGRRMALEAIARGEHTTLAGNAEEAERITAKLVAEKAAEGDGVAEAVMRETGRCLGKTLAVIVDLFNPDVIVIGGIYARNEKKLREYALPALEREALPSALGACTVVPSALGETIDEYAAFSAALYEE